MVSSELNMLKCLRWARWGWNCCKSPLSLAWLIFFSQFTLEGLWLALHQSVCCGTSGGKPLWPPSVSLSIRSAIRNRLWRAFVEVQFYDWGWVLHRMQQNSLFMSQSIITLSSGDRQWVLFGQHSSCRSGTASHFPVAIALQKAMPWVCRSVCLLLNPTSKCFCHSFCRELFSVSIHWEAPGEMVISFPARTFEGPFYNGGHLEGEGKERGILSHLQCWAFLLFIQILPLFNSAVQDGNSNKVSKQMLCREKLFLCGWFSCPVAKFYYE